MVYVLECSMKTSKSDSWILQFGMVGNQYLHKKSQCTVELGNVLFHAVLDYIISIWKLPQFNLSLSPLDWQYILKDSGLQCSRQLRNKRKMLSFYMLHGKYLCGITQTY